jgi:hypothetical protein
MRPEPSALRRRDVDRRGERGFEALHASLEEVEERFSAFGLERAEQASRDAKIRLEEVPGKTLAALAQEHSDHSTILGGRPPLHQTVIDEAVDQQGRAGRRDPQSVGKLPHRPSLFGDSDKNGELVRRRCCCLRHGGELFGQGPCRGASEPLSQHEQFGCPAR